MLKDDLLTGLVLSYLIAGFLIPTLINTGLYNKLPHTYLFVFLFAIFPILTLIGIAVAHELGKKVHIIWQFAKFALVGILNTAIDFGILNILVSLTGIYKGPATLFMDATAFSTAVINSYYWNRKWTFHGAKQADFISFVAVTLIGLSINASLVFVITTFVQPHFVQTGQQWINVAKAMATAISLFWNFTGYKVIVFKK
jgi:putative flippase GtrA